MRSPRSLPSPPVSVIRDSIATTSVPTAQLAPQVAPPELTAQVPANPVLKSTPARTHRPTPAEPPIAVKDRPAPVTRIAILCPSAHRPRRTQRRHRTQLELCLHMHEA